MIWISAPWSRCSGTDTRKHPMSCYSPELVLRTEHIFFFSYIFSELATVLIFIRKGLFHWSVPKVCCKNNSVICSAKYLFYRWKNKTKPNRTKKEKYRWEVREKEQSLFDTHIHVRFSYLIIKERTEIVKNLLKPKYCCIQPSKKGFTVNAVIAILS